MWLSRNVRQVCDGGVPTADHVLGHRRLRDLDAQLLELPVNPRRAPEGVGLGHPSDERSDLRGDGSGGLARSGGSSRSRRA